MRPGPNKRSRGRNNGSGASGPHNNNNNNNRPRTPHRSQTFDSNGPAGKIRGNAYQVFERYVTLAREASASGDRIAAESFYQYAEHYFRIMNANGENPAHIQNRNQPMGEPESDSENDASEGDAEAPAEETPSL